MNNPLRFLSGFCFALALVSLAAPSIRAQDYDSMRVVRLSRAEGQVQVLHAGSDAWEDAPANLPLQEGDTLATQDGLAEVEFENGATAYVAENSTLQFAGLGFSGEGGRVTSLNLTSGAATFYANPTTQDSFRVATPTLDVAIAERAEFRADAFRDGAAVQALLGTVTVSTTRGSTQLEKGQSVAVHENDLQDFSVGRLPVPDAFDQWVTEEGEIIRSGNKNTLSYINSPNYYGLSDLALYGTWINLPGLGISWRPFRAGISWTPYQNGIWVLDARLGWIWVSNEPWGWMPYHFGTWQLSPTLGWIWIAGGPAGLRHWEPSRVNWVRAGNQVGWVAKSPNDRDGAPANVANGVHTRPGRPSQVANGGNEILSGKALLGATPVKGPPPEFASHPSSMARRSENPVTIRPAAPMQDPNSSIVFDRGTHTFINRDGTGGAQNDSRARAGALPRPGSQNEIPRVTIPPSGAMDSRTDRVLLPPPYPVAPPVRQNAPPSENPPARPPIAPKTMNPLGSMPRTVAPPVMPAPVAPGQQMRGNPGPAVPPPPVSSAPRPVAPPSAPPQPQAPPQHMQNQLGSAARPAAPQGAPAPRAPASPTPTPDPKR
ncbi:MAG: FecR family protein [Acidobacteriia bacterium]|nr:FecR family protein [Terriglobia bacterium]